MVTLIVFFMEGGVGNLSSLLLTMLSLELIL